MPDEFTARTTIKYISSIHYYFLWLKLLIKRKVLLLHTSLFVIEPGNTGYFHWMTETLPRLLAIPQHNKEQPVILPQIYDQYLFISESLKILGFKIKYLPLKDFTLLREVHFISHFASAGNYNDYFIRKLRSELTKIYAVNKPEKRIYISRTKANRRKILNENEILPLLQYFKFEVIYCDSMSLMEQVMLFSQTTILVSNHGAGLTNMLFMKPESVVLELRSKGDSHNNCYFSLASALQIGYYYCECSRFNDNIDPHLADLIADKEELKAVLTEILSSYKN